MAKPQKEAIREAEDVIETVLSDLEEKHGVRVYSMRVNHGDDAADSVTIIPDSTGGRY